MSKFNNANSFQTVVELLYEEIKTFRNEHKEEYRHLEKVINDQNNIMTTHSEQLVKLVQVVHGNGNKGLVDRIEQIEKTQEVFAKKFSDIETKEKVRAAVLGVICAICSSIGGVITYIISVYTSFHK